VKREWEQGMLSFQTLKASCKFGLCHTESMTQMQPTVHVWIWESDHKLITFWGVSAISGCISFKGFHFLPLLLNLFLDFDEVISSVEFTRESNFCGFT